MPSSVELCRRIFISSICVDSDAEQTCLPRNSSCRSRFPVSMISFSLCRFADTSSAGNFPIARRYPILLGIKAIFLEVLGEIEQYVSIDG